MTEPKCRGPVGEGANRPRYFSLPLRGTGVTLLLGWRASIGSARAWLGATGASTHLLFPDLVEDLAVVTEGRGGASLQAADADLDLERARRFLTAYRNEGGPVRAAEDRNIIPLIRMRLRDEVRVALAQPGEQSQDDKEYTEREIAAFERLRGREVDWS